MPEPVDVQLAAYQATLFALGYRLEFPEREGECDVFHLVTGGKLGSADKTDPDSAGNAARVLGGQLNFDRAKDLMP